MWLLLALVAVAVPVDGTTVVAYVTVQGSVCTSYPSAPPGGYAAIVSYTPSMGTIGWDVLDVRTNASVPDEVQAYAAGCGEGMLTALAMNNFYSNIFVEGFVPPKAPQFLLANWNYTVEMAQQLNSSSAYWAQVALQVKQFQGLLAGVNAASPTQWTTLMLLEMEALGDFDDLIPALQEKHDDWRSMSKREYEKWFMRRTHCSALVKVLPNTSDIFFSHVTWTNFNSMHRVFKTYALAYSAAASKSISFSSYPGIIVSIDDFYVTDTKLGIMETSLVVFNTSMYTNNVQPNSLLYWVRVMVASRMATTGSAWVNIFARENSGTYNNQWMVLDFKRFTPLSDILPDTLWIAEQFPGVVGLQDVSGILQYGYWPSYNVPSMPDLFELSGYAEAVKQQGYEMNDYQRCVRAQIFRRDQGRVQDLASFQYMMQYNDYKNDPISMGNPLYAISSRGDLMSDPTCFGAVDVKVTSYTMMTGSKPTVLAYSGPTPQQGSFSFSTTKAKDCGTIKGIPNTFNFTWVPFTL